MTQTTEARSEERPAATPFEAIGGRGAVAALVNRFYDLMDSEPQYAELRRMHEPDLGPMRDSLTGFLTAWLGGPRDWFEARPGACIMSAHARFAITAETARQWNDAMSRSLGDSGVDVDLRRQIEQAFGRMSQGMMRG